jgi:hypothetical protein
MKKISTIVAFIIVTLTNVQGLEEYNNQFVFQIGASLIYNT